MSTATTSDPSPQSTGENGRLVGTMGTVSLILTVLAMSAPLGAVAGALPLVISPGNGIGAPGVYAVIGGILLLFAVGFTTMARVFPRTGAFYAYITGGLGREAGLAGGFIALLGYLTMLLGMYAFFGVACGPLVQSFFPGVDLPWWVYGAGLWVVVAIFGHFNIDLSAKVLSFLMALEVIAVMILNVPVLATGGPQGYQFESFTPSGFTSGSIGLGILFASATYLGFESTAIYRSEVKDPKRTVPRATYLAIILISLFYLLSSWALVTFYGVDHVVDVATTDGVTMFSTALGHYAGSVVTEITRVLIVTSMFAATLAPQNALARYVCALGRDGVLPRRLGKAHPKHGSPAIASATVAAVGLVLSLPFLGMDGVTWYSWMFGIMAYSILIVMAITSLAVIVYFRRTPHEESTWSTVIAPALGFLGLLTLIVITSFYFPLLVGGSMALGIFFQLLVVVAAVLGYVLAAIWKRRKPQVYNAIGGQIDPSETSFLAAAADIQHGRT
jgi:amino acid transporter